MAPSNRDATDTPADHPNHAQPIQRWEFNALRDSVGRIERALIGRNPMSPDPDAVVGKVEQHDRDIAHAKWLSRGAAGGVLAAAGAWAWNKLTGTHP